MHLANYPTLPPLANARAQAALAPMVAPAIIFGTGLDNDNVDKARFEYKQRKIFHTTGMVTKTELLHARLRYVAIRNEYAARLYPQTPQSTLDVIRRLCGQLEDENSSRLAAIRADIATVRCALDHADSVLNGEVRPVKNEKTSHP